MFARLLLERTEDMAKDGVNDLFGDRIAQAIADGRVLSEMNRDQKRAAKKEYDRLRYVEKCDEVKARAAQWYADNTERALTRINARYHEKAPEILAKEKAKRDRLIAEDPTYRDRENAQGRKQRAANRELYRAIGRRGYYTYTAVHPGRAAELQRLRYWANPEKARLRGILDANNRRARILCAPGDLDLTDINELRRRQKNKCAFCLKPLGKQTPHLDHYVSLARGGTNEMSNLRLLHRLCNMRKHAKHPLDFGLENGLLAW
jgi:5-methylcytosine-specific restriction endonuclease McrA